MKRRELLGTVAAGTPGRAKCVDAVRPLIDWRVVEKRH